MEISGERAEPTAFSQLDRGTTVLGIRHSNRMGGLQFFSWRMRARMMRR